MVVPSAIHAALEETGPYTFPPGRGPHTLPTTAHWVRQRGLGVLLLLLVVGWVRPRPCCQCWAGGQACWQCSCLQCWMPQLHPCLHSKGMAMVIVSSTSGIGTSVLLETVLTCQGLLLLHNGCCNHVLVSVQVPMHARLHGRHASFGWSGTRRRCTPFALPPERVWGPSLEPAKGGIDPWNCGYRRRPCSLKAQVHALTSRASSNPHAPFFS